MRPLHVRLEHRGPVEALPALLALVGPLSPVHLQVVGERRFVLVALAAYLAEELALVEVDLFVVGSQKGAADETLAAYLARVRPGTGVVTQFVVR